ncbi:MAG: hypothetical protein WBD51_07385, partial [Burkholderiaceae bacterium]
MKRFKYKVLTAAIAVTTCIALPFSANAEDKKHKFSMTASWGGGPLFDVCIKNFTDKVAQFTGGRVTIEAFPPGTLGPALKVSETVKNGIAQMGHTWIGYDWGQDPTAVLFGGFAGSTDTEKMLHWLYR